MRNTAEIARTGATLCRRSGRCFRFATQPGTENRNTPDTQPHQCCGKVFGSTRPLIQRDRANNQRDQRNTGWKCGSRKRSKPFGFAVAHDLGLKGTAWAKDISWNADLLRPRET